MTNNGKLLVEILNYFTIEELEMLQDKVTKLIAAKKVSKKLVELLLKNDKAL